MTSCFPGAFGLGRAQPQHRGTSPCPAIILLQALVSVTPDEETYDEEDAAFCLEMLLRIEAATLSNWSLGR